MYCIYNYLKMIVFWYLWSFCCHAGTIIVIHWFHYWLGFFTVTCRIPNSIEGFQIWCNHRTLFHRLSWWRMMISPAMRLPRTAATSWSG